MASKKGMSLNISPEQVMATSMRTTKGGYNSASMAVKLGDNEYMSISYEWEGNNVTDLAMDFMSFMQANKVEIEAAVEAHKDEMAAKKGKMPPWMNKDEEDEEDMEDDKKSKKDKKDKKDKKSKK